MPRVPRDAGAAVADALARVRSADAAAATVLTRKLVLHSYDNADNDAAAVDQVDVARRATGAAPPAQHGGAPRALTTLDLFVKGAKVPRTMDTVGLTVSQSQTKRIGSGFVETVKLSAGGVGLMIHTAAARKFASEADRVRHMHLDVEFTHLDLASCEGVLPEIWGAKPRSSLTHSFLLPRV